MEIGDWDGDWGVGIGDWGMGDWDWIKWGFFFFKF